MEFKTPPQDPTKQGITEAFGSIAKNFRQHKFMIEILQNKQGTIG